MSGDVTLGPRLRSQLNPLSFTWLLTANIFGFVAAGIVGSMALFVLLAVVMVVEAVALVWVLRQPGAQRSPAA